jgi:fatty-acyl-CoA synthase
MLDDIAFQSKLQPTKLALQDLKSDRKWDYAGLDRMVAQCAAVLLQHGLGRGQRLVGFALNCAELVFMHAACARLGSIYVPVNWRLSSVEVELLIEDADPSLLVGDELLNSITSDVPRLSIDQLYSEILHTKPLETSRIDKSEVSLILYTSGTSGKPKGVLLTEHNIDQTAQNFSLLGRVSESSVFLCDSPMFHILGIISNVRPVFLRGASLLISDGFDPKRTLQRMADPVLAVSHYFGVPQMAFMMRQQANFEPTTLKNMKAIFTGGAPHPKADILSWLDDGIAIVDGFGMSESGTTLGMSLDLDVIRTKAGSVGVPTPNIETRIVDDSGKECCSNQAGELLLRGANITQGYWRNPKATAEAFTDDGWFKTGDIASCDEDGFIYIVDRKKDMFISGGENIYPAEIEAALSGLKGVLELAVVGMPDAKWGEIGHVAVVCEENIIIDINLIKQWLNPKLASYKLPKRVTMLPELPRTGSGKIQKKLLKEQLLKAGSE